MVIGSTVDRHRSPAPGGCGSSKPSAHAPSRSVTPRPPTGPVLLAQFDKGIGAVAEGSPAPVWLEPDAVAALDGSAVFTVRRGGPDGADRLARLDLRSGAVTSSWPLSTSGLAVNAVAPEGRWVALSDRNAGYGSQGRAATDLVVFDPLTGTEAKRMTLKGDVQPEAFSVDGKFVFAIDYLVDHYRVHTIEVATGESYDTADRDKTLPPEDMHGQSVHGVMSRDRTLLATLYRNPGNDKSPRSCTSSTSSTRGRTAPTFPRPSAPDRRVPTRSS